MLLLEGYIPPYPTCVIHNGKQFRFFFVYNAFWLQWILKWDVEDILFIFLAVLCVLDLAIQILYEEKDRV